MAFLETFMDPNAQFRQRARQRIAKRTVADLEQAALQQERRAMKMSRKVGRGNRRAAKASQRAAALHEQAASTRVPIL